MLWIKKFFFLFLQLIEYVTVMLRGKNLNLSHGSARIYKPFCGCGHLMSNLWELHSATVHSQHLHSQMGCIDDSYVQLWEQLLPNYKQSRSLVTRAI